ncbi:homocysteine S-methyltransferase family protein [Rubritalea marina]|uniref:homocysteine S-methyltransferase family protein n=1 Tax=Rubritalea marina TaxID=361055 RepID=UPI00036B8EA0|nr:homocysteine S-methyltransferase family protein [Rubritalea marina]
MQRILESPGIVLGEGAIAERLRRIPGVELHPELFNAPLIYDDALSLKMAAIHSEYYQVAREFQLPLLSTAPTWRLDRERLERNGFAASMNIDAVNFLKELRHKTQSQHPDQPSIWVGSLLGPKNDCYRPELALSASESEQFHRWQIEQLAEAQAEFIIAQTIPAVSEAEGILRAAQQQNTPMIMSFCINADMQVLDGTPLDEAIHHLDQINAPLAYAVNCVYPSTLKLKQLQNSERVLGIWANASSLSHDQLEHACCSQSDSISDWLHEMQSLRKQGLRVFGGCCGTTTEHLRGLAQLQS